MNKQEVFNINGMMRDLGNSKSSPKYAYDIMNMRLFNFEENTAGNLCNDYGNHFLPVVDSEGDYYDVLGQTVGICKINSNTIIIFTAGESNSYIYKGILKVDNSALECSLLYLGDLKFNTNHPIESLYNYENEKSLKIYWTDGKNPLRLINLAADSETMSSWVDSSFLFNPYLQLDERITVNKIAGGGQFHAGTVQYAFTYYNLYGPESAIFYNTPLYYASPDDRGGAADEIINCSFNINIKSFDRRFDFLRVYAIQRTSINGTPVARKVSDIVIPKTDIIVPLLYANELYFTYQDLLNNSVTLTDINDNEILNAGTTIINGAITSGSSKIYRVYGSSYKKLKINDYTMYISDDEIYTITWVATNLNGNTLVLITNSLGEVAYKEGSDDHSQLIIIDDGIVGESVDYTSLLYKGGEEITAQTLDSKDNTLFLGNISLKKPSLLNLNVGGTPLTEYVKNLSVEFNYNGNKTLPSPTKNSFYPYINLLRYNSELIKHFKQGSVYRLGFLAQYQDGSWSTVIYIKDVLNDKPIRTTFYEDGEFQFPTPEVILDQPLISTLLNAGYKRVRPVVAFSNLPQWSFLGVVNPTMYKIDSRAKNTLFSQASWFYRPSSPYDYSRTVNVSLASAAPYQVDVFDIDTAKYGYDANGKRGVLEKWSRLDFGIESDVDYKASRFFTLTGQHHTIANSALNTSLKLVNKLWAEYGADIEFRHGMALNGNLFKKSEIQCLSNIDKYKLTITDIPSYIRPFKNAKHTDQETLDSYLDNYGQTYIIDQSIFNIDSPDLNFDSLLNRSLDNSKFRIVGAIPMTTNYSAYDIMIDGTTTPYTWNSLAGSDVKEKDTVWAPPHTINEYMLRKVLPANIGSNPDVDEYPLIPRELAIRYPDGQVDLKLGTNLFSPQAWRTNSAVPIWQDNMVTASLFRNEVGTVDGEWTAYTATSALYTNTHRTLFPDNFDAYFTIYPWHGRILNNYTTKLKTKILSNIKVSFKSIYLNNFYTNMLISSPALFTSDLDIIKIQDYFGNTILYGGNVDQICSPKIDSDNLGYDITLLKGTNTTEIKKYYGWGAFPKHVSWTRGKMLKKDFFSKYSDKPLTSVENELRISESINLKERSYMDFNFRKMDGASANQYYRRDFMRHITSKDPVSIKYKTTKHLVVTSKAYFNPTYNTNEVEILPTILDSRVDHLYSSYTGHPAIPQEVWVYRNWAVNQLPTNFYIKPSSSESYYPFWSDSPLKFKLNVIESSDLQGPAITSKSILFGWLWLGELYNDIVAFSESSEENLELYIWHPCASPIKLISNSDISMYYYEGDTYYQRYDSLKTYPYTNDDPNLVVDVVSFMCETAKNIDGRYDKNRNTTFTSTISPTNFNLINEVYSQPNNFFQQRYISKVQSAIDKFENAITWSLTKTNGEEIDSWTKLNLASILDLDGDRGSVNKIKKFNNDLIAFQDSAIANILYNSNVQIASTTGVPIEISNSYKVDGKRYLSTNIGCKNKWSITETPSGLYFVDDLNKKLYLFQQGLKGISEEKGFNSWFHEQCNNNIWTPKDSLNFVTYFDNYYRELLLINKDNCLAFSEVSNEFTSFYSYEKTPYFTNLNKERLFIKYGNNGNSEFYLGNTTPDSSGTNKYFFEEKPVYVTLKIQSNPLMDKVFNGVEYRNEFYTADGEDNFITDEHMFDNLNIWTDYQSGTLDINKVVGLPSSLKLKFRINRVLLPRDTSNPNLMKRRDRIRNPWAFILLKADTNKAKFRIHDIVVNYTE